MNDEGRLTGDQVSIGEMGKGEDNLPGNPPGKGGEARTEYVLRPKD